jgi:aspartyl/asparaginyl-tRNA synthetase
MEMKGIQPDQIALYLQHFQRGAAQTGGFGIGLERYMALVLGSTARLMAPFPKTANGYIG